MKKFNTKLAAHVKQLLEKRAAPASIAPASTLPGPGGAAPKRPITNPKMTAALQQAQTRMQSLPGYQGPGGYSNMRVGLGGATVANAEQPWLRTVGNQVLRRLPRLEAASHAILQGGMTPQQVDARYGVKIPAGPPQQVAPQQAATQPAWASAAQSAGWKSAPAPMPQQAPAPQQAAPVQFSKYPGKQLPASQPAWAAPAPMPQQAPAPQQVAAAWPMPQPTQLPGSISAPILQSAQKQLTPGRRLEEVIQQRNPNVTFERPPAFRDVPEYISGASTGGRVIGGPTPQPGETTRENM